MSYRRFKVEKLVRDKAIERLNRKGAIVYSSQATPEEYIPLLLNKLKEETEEVISATTKQERINELADLMEVIRALAKASSITLEDIEKKRREAVEERGSFDERVVCHYIDALEDSPAAKYCREQPEKYPEIDKPVGE